jgi:hypothetical protein
MDRSAAAAGRIVAGGIAGQAIAANHQFSLEPRLVVLIRRLLLLPVVLWLKLAVSFARRSVERADDDFPLRSRLLWPKLKRLRFFRRGCAKPVPRDRAPGRGRTAAPRRAAIGQRQRGNKERNASRNHRDRLGVRQAKT